MKVKQVKQLSSIIVRNMTKVRQGNLGETLSLKQSSIFTKSMTESTIHKFGENPFIETKSNNRQIYAQGEPSQR